MVQIDASTDVNIYQESGNWYYIIGTATPEPITTFPIVVVNPNIGLANLEVSITTDIIITADDQYLEQGSEAISFSAFRKTITVDGVPNYPGFIRNGSLLANGFNRSNVSNIGVSPAGGSTLATGAGWVCQEYFGKGATSCFITNCWSSGDIPANCGGIVGRNCAILAGSDCYISQCHSLGDIGTNSGGICGTTIGNIIIVSCYSSGDITGTAAGGILGADSNIISTAPNFRIDSCYSSGDILGVSAGGIVGKNAGANIRVINSYSTGAISLTGGGIFGEDFNVGVLANNCYTSGTGNGGQGGIFSKSSDDNLQGANNYSEYNNGGTAWTDANARIHLLDAPSAGFRIGDIWCSITANTPYEFNGFGYSPYDVNPQSNYDETIRQGANSVPGLLTGYTYSILAVKNVDDEEIPTPSGLTINSSTGIISVGRAVPVGEYTLYIRDSINPYDITQFLLTVDLFCYGPGTQILIGIPSTATEPNDDKSDLEPGFTDTDISTTIKPKIISRYADIASLRPGMLVKTRRHGYLPIEAIGVKTIRTGGHPKTRMFKLPAQHADQTELLVTGGHSILLTDKHKLGTSGEQPKIQQHKLDGCRRVLAMDWPGAKPSPARMLTPIYHLVLAGPLHRYAIWVNGGWLSESTSREHFKQYRFTPLN